MPFPLPPDGWTVRDGARHTVIWGFDYATIWPLGALMVGGALLGIPILRASVRLWAIAVGIATLAAVLRGFRLEISPRGYAFERTWAGIALGRRRLPLDASVAIAGGFDGPDDRVVLERSLHREDVTIGSPQTCHALYRAIVDARDRWAASAPPTESKTEPTSQSF